MVFLNKYVSKYLVMLTIIMKSPELNLTGRFQTLCTEMRICHNFQLVRLSEL